MSFRDVKIRIALGDVNDIMHSSAEDLGDLKKSS